MHLSADTRITTATPGSEFICEACGAAHESVATIGPAFRERELRAGRCDPGELCINCAETWIFVLRTEGLAELKPKKFQ